MDENDFVNPVDIKFIATRFAQKLVRFVFLGHIYLCYGVFEDLIGVNLHGFPVVYIYAWVIFSILIGMFLFMFGRSTLFDRDTIQMVSNLNWNFVNKMCNGTVYRFFCIWLHWLYPFIVASICGCYFHAKIPHSRFVLTYYSVLAFVEFKDFRTTRWLAQTFTTAAHLYVAALVGDFWGFLGSVLMVGNMLLVVSAKELSTVKFKGWEVSMPALMAFSSLGCSFVLTKSIGMMSSTRGGESVDVPSIEQHTLMEALGWVL
ncbi:unnamed protein product [Allacma fusca]|uniref:Uncharacterized protein n=1 Tax=Allacma fusca TaxID=39272 RepID=A0A8J2PUN1_9HEXA|nr:unnamed protein product [Allacma fusca]